MLDTSCKTSCRLLKPQKKDTENTSSTTALSGFEPHIFQLHDILYVLATCATGDYNNLIYSV